MPDIILPETAQTFLLELVDRSTKDKMKNPLPRIHCLIRPIEAAFVEIEIPSYLDIFSIRVIAPQFVLEGTCAIEKFDSQFGMVTSGTADTMVFNCLLSFPIEKSLVPHDRIYMKFYFRLPDVFPENEVVKVYVIAQ